MAVPPRDNNGVVLPHNDDDITDDDGMLRKIHPDYHVFTDSNTGERRISSAAFKESQRNAPYGGMSADIESLVIADGVSPESRAEGQDGLVRLPVGVMRELGFQVGSDPITDEKDVPDNPYHGEVWGIDRGMRKKPKKRAVMNSYQWVKRLDGVE